MTLPNSFYRREDTLKIARELIGKVLVTEFDGIRTSGMIVETEAYCGVSDRGCHAYGGRRTNRTEIMYAPGGVAYVYLCYGIHHLFNVITHKKDSPHAVLIRGIEPLEGINTMLQRRKMNTPKPALTAGPGSLSAALGIKTGHTGLTLIDSGIRIEDQGTSFDKSDLIASPRVGIAYAKEDALLPRRFRLRNSRWTSPAK